MSYLRRQWIRMLYRTHQAKLGWRSLGAVFRGYSNYLRPGSRAYQRHVEEEVEQYGHVHADTDDQSLLEPAPPSWFDMQGRVAHRIREATGDDMLGHVQTKLRARAGVRMLSLGSGPGGLELSFARDVPSAEIVCMDLNPGLLERGRAQASDEGLAVKFEHADLNLVELPAAEFDLVFCHASLHHLLELEHVFGQIKRTLRPAGELIVIDVVTRHGYRMWPETRKVVDAIWKTLPPRYRVNHTAYHVKMEDRVMFEADTRSSGMECIRSEDILPLLAREFDPVAYVPYHSLCRRFFDTMYGPNYDLDPPLHCAILDWIWELDCHYLDTGVLKPETFFGIYRPSR